MPIYEPLFSEDSFGYRPGRGAKDAIFRIKEYIEQGYTRAVVLDLSKVLRYAEPHNPAESVEETGKR